MVGKISLLENAEDEINFNKYVEDPDLFNLGVINTTLNLNIIY